MKKLMIITAAFLAMYAESLNSVHRVAFKLYEGWDKHNDLYLVSCNGYYMPLIADDLQPGDHVLYTAINEATYTTEGD